MPEGVVPSPRRRLFRPIPIAIAAAVVVAVIIFAVVLLTRPGSFNFNGELSLAGIDGTDFYSPSGGSDCQGMSGYDDIARGAQIIVTDQTGATVAVGSLGSGTKDGSDLSCDFRFHVDSVPGGK